MNRISHRNKRYTHADVFPIYWIAILAALAVSWSSFGSPPPLDADAPDDLSKAVVPHAGYAAALKARRLEERIAEVNGVPFPKAAKRHVKVPVICVDFPDLRGTYPTSAYQQLLFDQSDLPGQRKTLTKYYRDNSRNLLTVTGPVIGWFTLPKQHTYYAPSGSGAKDSNLRFGKLLQFAFTRADESLDWGQFDNDGADGVPNSGDDDGKVDAVLVIQAGIGAETGSPGFIRSHFGHFNDKGYGHRNPFVTHTLRFGHSATEGESAYISIDDYDIQPALSRWKGTDGKNQIIEVGVFCHEYGHVLGLPDLYDRTPTNGPDSLGVGNYCLMAYGMYGGDSVHADAPVALCAWCKQRLGWADVATIQDTGNVDFESVEYANKILRIDVPNTAGTEYFLIEHRNSSWQDPTGDIINWDSTLPGSGLAIWHVDERVGKSGGKWPFADFDSGQNDSRLFQTIEVQVSANLVILSYL